MAKAARGSGGTAASSAGETSDPQFGPHADCTPVIKPMTATLAAVLKNDRVLPQPLTQTERAFLKRWVADGADEPIWAKIVTDARVLGCWPNKTLYSQLIWYV